MVELHPPDDAAHGRRTFIAREIAIRVDAEVAEHLPQQRSLVVFDLFVVGGNHDAGLGSIEAEDCFPGISATGRVRSTRPRVESALLGHGVEFGVVLRILNDYQAALGLDVLNAERSVRSGAGENDADGMTIMSGGKSPEEVVDGEHAGPAAPRVR